jgi:hypothetical protein
MGFQWYNYTSDACITGDIDTWKLALLVSMTPVKLGIIYGLLLANINYTGKECFTGIKDTSKVMHRRCR